MPLWSTSFENGVPGASVVGSDFDPNGWADGNTTYSNSYVKSGAISVRCALDLNAAPGTTASRLSLPLPSGPYTTDVYGRAYFMLPAAPVGGNVQILSQVASSFKSNVDIEIRTDGKLTGGVSTSNWTFTSMRAITPGSWFRVEWHVNTGAGVGEIRLFFNSVDGTTPDETYTWATTETDSQGIYMMADAQWGMQTVVVFIDSPAVDTAGWLGPDVTATTRVTTSAASAWNVRTGVTKVCSGVWNVMRPVVISATSQWGVLTGQSLQRTSVWRVLQQVVEQDGVAWNVRALVSAGRSSSWTVRAAVSIARTARWSISQSVSRPATALWHVRVPVSVPRVSAWGVRVAVSSLAAMRWAVRSQVPVRRTARWQVSGKPSISVASQWNVRTNIQTSSSSAWKSSALVRKQASALWHARRLTAKTTTTGWNVYAVGSGASSKTLTWNVRRSSATSAAGNWGVRKTVAVSRSSSWNDIKQSRVSFTCNWNVRPFVIDPDIPLMPLRAPVDMREASRRLL